MENLASLQRAVKDNLRGGVGKSKYLKMNHVNSGSVLDYLPAMEASVF